MSETLHARTPAILGDALSVVHTTSANGIRETPGDGVVIERLTAARSGREGIGPECGASRYSNRQLQSTIPS